jgi:hypothetical protein
LEEGTWMLFETENVIVNELLSGSGIEYSLYECTFPK